MTLSCPRKVDAQSRATRQPSRGDSSLKHSVPEEESKETLATNAVRSGLRSPLRLHPGDAAWSNPASDDEAETEEALADYDEVQRGALLEQLRELKLGKLNKMQQLHRLTVGQHADKYSETE